MNRLVSTSEIVPLRAGQGRVDDLLDAAVPVRAERPLAANDTGTDLGNVVPFMRPRGGRAAPTVALPADAAQLVRPSLTRERARLAALITLSLAVHAGLFAAFWREPTPLASIGVEVISLEIVVGATAPAGAAVTEGQQEVNAAAAPETETPESEKADTKATTQEQTVEVAKQETAPEQQTPPQKAEIAKPEEQKYETAAAPEEPAVAEQKPAVAMVETPTPDTATAKPQDVPPPPTEVTLLPQPEEKPIEKKVERKPVQAAPPKPVKDAKPAKEAKRIAAPTRENASREAKTSTPSTAANNFGVGRSNRDSNYPGIVRAHLARYKQSLGSSQGSATVSFTLSGSGGVAGVRLARASGVAAIDQEVQAMVRRASPFPPPPDGRSQSFTVPVSFISQ